jgi:hypothetical protein
MGIAARLGKNITMIGKLMYDSSYDESHGDGQSYPGAAGKNLLLHDPQSVSKSDVGAYSP